MLTSVKPKERTNNMPSVTETELKAHQEKIVRLKEKWGDN